MEIWCFHSSTKIKQLCCWCSIAQLCLTLCDPMDRNTPRFPVHHQFPELAQTHVHRVGDAIQPSHPLSSPSPPDFYLSQHQSLFKHVDALHQVAKILELQHQSFHWIFRVDFLYDRLVWSPWSSKNCQESSPTPQFKSSNSSVFSLLHSPTLTSIHDYWKNHSFDYTDLCQQSNVFAFYTLSRFVIDFLPRSRHLLISWLQSPSAVI